MCRKFEHVGIPCRHILAVLNKKSVAQIPDAFVLRRWTMHANRLEGLLPYDMNIGGSHEMTPTERFNNMSMLTMTFCHSSIASKERYDYAVDVINREIMNLENMSVDGVDCHESDIGTKMGHTTNVDFNAPILDPIVSQTKGRKKAERFKSTVETLGKEKPKRLCKHCRREGHDKRNCPTRLEQFTNPQI